VTANPLVSVLVNNYNYAPFLAQAIDSALAQTYSPIEIVAVDDGSTDQSRRIIADYGNKVIPVLKRNGGQASAFNAGVAKSRGDILCLLDSDDYFATDKVARVVVEFEKENFQCKPMMVHHRLSIIGESAGDYTGRSIGRTHNSPLNLYDFARRYGFLLYMASPTTGLSLNRNLADRLFPIPQDGIRTSADDFIVMGASLVGELHSLDVVLGSYRIHGQNAWFNGDRRKPEFFRDALDRYLNTKLVESGRRPVMSFRRSMIHWPDLALERRWFPLLASIAKLSVLQHDKFTARFAYQALRLAIKGQSERERTNTSLIQ
jgi:glycosyltransferase involved in cell wall biosynthesis